MIKNYILTFFALITFLGAKSQQMPDNGWPLNFKSATVYKWVANNWAEYLKMTPTYASGKIQDITAKINAGGNWVDAMRLAVTYDGQGRIETRNMYTFTNNDWKISTTDSFFYNNDKPSTVITYTMESGSWARLNRDTYIYGSNGLLAEIFHQDVDQNNGSWSNDDYMYYYYDAQSRLSSIIRKDWNGATYVGKRNSTLTYNGMSLEIVEQDTANGAWTNSSKFVFDSAVIVTPTAIKNKIVSTSGLSAYPNPVKNNLNVNLAASVVNSEIMVRDISGRIFIHRTVPANTQNITLNTEALPSGIYILSVSNASTKSVLRFVKE